MHAFIRRGPGDEGAIITMWPNACTIKPLYKLQETCNRKVKPCTVNRIVELATPVQKMWLNYSGFARTCCKTSATSCKLAKD